nr:MAG TPA: Alginate and motility regulator [Caudoviricetes sp.]
MSPKTGRPQVEKPLIIEIKARIDKDTNDKLIRYCKDNNVTRTDVVRKGIQLVLQENK